MPGIREVCLTTNGTLLPQLARPLVDAGVSRKRTAQALEESGIALRELDAIFITHEHSDHIAGFSLFLKKYSSSLNIERMIYNFPSTMTEDGVLSGHKSNYQKLINYIKDYAGNVRFLKIHTGMSVTLCDLTINCIYTHEDLVDKSTGKTRIASGRFSCQ